MRTNVDLDLFGHAIRIVSEVPDAVTELRSVMSEFLSTDEAPVGFILKAPVEPTGLYVLIDRSGLILARARKWVYCLAALLELLASFAPRPAGTVRLFMRAIVREGWGVPDAVVAAFPMLALPPLVERQLARSAHLVVDRLAVDSTPDGVLSLAAAPWPTSSYQAAATGHCGSQSASGARISSMLVPAVSAADPSLAYLTAAITPNVHARLRAEALNVAEYLGARGDRPIQRLFPTASSAGEPTPGAPRLVVASQAGVVIGTLKVDAHEDVTALARAVRRALDSRHGDRFLAIADDRGSDGLQCWIVAIAAVDDLDRYHAVVEI